MALSFQIPTAAASESGSGNGGGSNNTTTDAPTPYVLNASVFPAPSELPVSGIVSSLAAVPLSSSVSAYAVVYGLTNSTGSSLWFAQASYDSQDAKLIALTGSCGVTCGALPLAWSSPVNISDLPAPATSIRLASAGPMIVAEAAANGSTFVYASSPPFSSWSQLGGVLSGNASGLAADSEEVAVTTLGRSTVYVTTVSTSGELLGRADLSAGSSNVSGASVALTPDGPQYLESVSYSAGGAIEFASSTDGLTFTTPTTIASYNSGNATPSISSVGDTALRSAGGSPGQLQVVSDGSDLLILYTTLRDGAVVPMTLTSGDNGTRWSGPYATTTGNGSIATPTDTVGPTGLVYAAWDEPDYDTGAIAVATYASDGLVDAVPETILSSNTGGAIPDTAPALAVDALAQPLVLWGAVPVNGTNDTIEYTGGFLPAATALSLSESIVTATVADSDLATPSKPHGVASLQANVTGLVGRIDANLSVDRLCNAQNLTALHLYPNLTHLPLQTAGGAGIVCSPSLDPDVERSPVAPSEGLGDADTFYAVYADWVLEAEGVTVSVSPLTNLTQAYPYSNLALTAALPTPVSGSVTVDSSSETVTAAPTPYSPTAYELSVAASLPSWVDVISSVKCTMSGGGWGTDIVEDVTSVAGTKVSVQLFDGADHVFNGTTAYPSPWITNLTAERSYSWSAKFTASTTEIHRTVDSCTGEDKTTTVSPENLGASLIPAVTLSGTFATSLSVTYGAGLLRAKLNGARTEASISLAFNNTLPATAGSTLSNASAQQDWSSAAFSTADTYTFPTDVQVGKTYTYSETSTSRAGSPTPPGSPYLPYGSSGESTTEGAGLSCRFTVSSAGPLVWTDNTTVGSDPYSQVNATTVEVTWFSSEDATGFFDYREGGSSIEQVVTDVRPIQVRTGNWSYSLEVYGLQSLANYSGSYGVSWTNGCLVEEDQNSAQVPHDPSDPEFATADPLSVSEVDQPFDSITAAGGGVNLTWPTPKKDQGLSVESGYVILTNLSDKLPNGKRWTETIPVSGAEVNQTPGKKDTENNLLSLDPSLVRGTKYRAALTMNYTGEKSQSGSDEFTYQKGGSGDGLTKAEKEAGWEVSYQPAGWQVISGNTTLHGDLIADNLRIEPQATLTTNGYSIIVSGSLVIEGTVVTGYVALGKNLKSANLPNSYGGSGGGAFDTGGAFAHNNGASTIVTGGTGTTTDHNAASGRQASTPKLSGTILGKWWNATDGRMNTYLGGASGGGWDGLPGEAGGLGAPGLYIQANSITITTGTIEAVGGPGGSEYASEGIAGGGGGGGTVILAYSASSKAPYTSRVFVGGGAGVSTPGGSSGTGGPGRVLTWSFEAPPVTVPPVSAVEHPDVTVFSTNGLANDYLEKAYGLNPNTVDTAGSDMLDLWNLTFDLGASSAGSNAIPTGVAVWWESNGSNTVWDPWGPEGRPTSAGSNLACTSTTQCPDNSSSVSSVLWSTSALSQLMNLSGVQYDLRHGGFLRGVVGPCPAAAASWCGSDLILTLWGKLSWGANPLAGSTPGDGIPDGMRVNPLGGTDVQVNVSYWSYNQTQLPNGAGVAVYIRAFSPDNAAPNGSGYVDYYDNFTSQVNISGGSTEFNGSYVVTFPVDPTHATVSLTVSIVSREYESSKLVTVGRSIPFSISLMDNVTQSDWVHQYGKSPTALGVHWRVLSTDAKDPTWIYIPTGNGTLSQLPEGLRRYTGEQNFIELVLDDTAPANSSPSVSNLPYSNNTGNPKASYSFELSPGLNTLLIPRSVFLSTPFGRSVLNLSGSSTPDVAIRDANGDGFLQSQWRSEGNGAFWFNRTTGVGGFTKGSEGYIQVIANTTSASSTDTSLTGGVPGDPTLEEGYGSLAIQAIYAANENSTSEVEGLLAGLLLNTSGSFTGWLLNATGELDTLGLLPSVMAGLPNAIYVNDGAYGPPTSSSVAPTPPLSWWKVPFVWVWNSVSGVFTGAISVVWNAAIAAAAFVGDLAKEATDIGLSLLSQVASNLRRAAQAIAGAFNALVDWVINHLVKPLLDAVLSPFFQADESYSRALNTTSTTMYTQVSDTGSPSSSTVGAFGTSFEGTLFLVGLALGATVEIALAVLTPLDFGPEFVVGLLLQAVGVGTRAATNGFGGVAAGLSAAAVWSVETAANETHIATAALRSVNWRTFALAFGLAASTVSLGLVTGLMRDDTLNPELVTIVFALGVVALGLDASSLIDHAPLLEDLAIILGAIGVVLGVIHTIRSTAFVQVTAEIATGLAVAGLGAAIYHAAST